MINMVEGDIIEIMIFSVMKTLEHIRKMRPIDTTILEFHMISRVKFTEAQEDLRVTISIESIGLALVTLKNITKIFNQNT